jgi:hypothetical protein
VVGVLAAAADFDLKVAARDQRRAQFLDPSGRHAKVGLHGSA